MQDPNEPKHESWTIADLIDFEVLMAEDDATSNEGGKELEMRDRGICRSIQPPTSTDSITGRGRLFHKWLEARLKDRFPGHDSPGKWISWWFGVIKIGLAIAGLGAARAMVWSFFHGLKAYDPSDKTWHVEPIHVFDYWLVCIGLTLALSLFGFWVLLANGSTSTMPRPPMLARSFLLGCLKPVLTKIASRVSDGLISEHRLKVKAIYGAMSQRMALRGDAVSFEFLCLLQVFGLSFACGVLMFSGFDLANSNRTFRWEGILFDWDASASQSVIRVISTPWSWFAHEGSGFPNFEQIRSTISNHDLSTLPHGAARAWARFVVLSALVYGVIPRAALYILSQIRLRRALYAANFDDPRSDALWERLMTPLVISVKGVESHFDPGSLSKSPSIIPPSSGSHTIILPSDLNDPLLKEAVANFMRQKGLKVGETVILPELPRDILKVVAGLPKSSVYVVHQSWMWQTGELKDLLREIRNSVGPKCSVILALLGKPNGEPLGDAPFARDVDVWQREIDALGDPYLGVRPFLPPQ